MKPLKPFTKRLPASQGLQGLARKSLATLIALSPALLVAQSDEELHLNVIADKLDAVTVYYLEYSGGERYSVDAGPGRPAVAPVFFYSASAQSLRDDLLTKEPPVETRLTAAGLGEVYMSIQDSASSSVSYALIGDPWQVNEARRLNEDALFNQTPVFAVQEAASGGFLTMRNSEGVSVMPLFIESQRALAAVELMEQQNPEVQQELTVIALPLQTAISDMVNGKLSAESVIFIPPQ